MGYRLPAQLHPSLFSVQRSGYNPGFLESTKVELKGVKKSFAAQAEEAHGIAYAKSNECIGKKPIYMLKYLRKASVGWTVRICLAINRVISVTT